MKILVLAGGFDQIALIQTLKRYQHTVLLTDYFENPPAKDFADHFFRISTLDEEAIFALAQREKVDLVTTACTDQALLTVARVSERLNLPCYLDSGKALSVTNKFYMKSVFKKCGIPTAPFVLLDKTDDWRTSLSLKEFPLIVKPCDCNSSKGVLKVENEAALEAALNTAFSLSRSGKAVVERFLPGEEISVDVWVEDDCAKVLCATQTRKLQENEDAFTIYQSCYPVAGYDTIEKQVQSIADKIAKGFGLRNCPLLIQAMVFDGEVYVIEFSARMGGGTKYKLIETISGIDIMDVYVRRVLGDEGQTVEPRLSKKQIELNYVYVFPGTVTDIIGKDKLLAEGVMKDCFIYKPLGAYVEKRTTSSDRVMGFLLTEDTPEKLEQARCKCLVDLDILDDGRSIMFRECFQ